MIQKSQNLSQNGWDKSQISVISNGETAVEAFLSENKGIRVSYEKRHFEEALWNFRVTNPFNNLSNCRATVVNFDVSKNSEALVKYSVAETGHQFIRRYNIPQSAEDVNYEENQLLRLNAYAPRSISYVTLCEGDTFPALLDGDIYEIWI
jgi:hypothetical protein